jgi:hypothetical protein
MRAQQQQQPPQEVLSYYVHGNPFVHQDNTHNRGRDTSANGNSQSAIQQQYMLAGARSAVATRLQVGQSLAQLCRFAAPTSALDHFADHVFRSFSVHLT